VRPKPFQRTRIRRRRSSRSCRPACGSFTRDNSKGDENEFLPISPRPVEPVDERLRDFYDRLLAVLRLPVVRDGRWELLECRPPGKANWTSDCWVAFGWQDHGSRLVVAVNFAANQSQCYVRLPFADLGGRQWRLQDHLQNVAYDRDGNDLQQRGLYLDAAPWQTSVFTMT
jgi:hypothetical protein